MAEIKKAKNTREWLRLALVGRAGSGKTLTALSIASGIAKKSGGRVAVIDTENRSASLYADNFHFDVCELERKTIEDYLSAVSACIKGGYTVLIVDSLSHAWLELVQEIRCQAAEKPDDDIESIWASFMPKQRNFIETLLNFPGHLIVTMRAKPEWITDENGEDVHREELIPEQADGIEYEFDQFFEMTPSHYANVVKDRTGIYQGQILKEPGEQIGLDYWEWLKCH